MLPLTPSVYAEYCAARPTAHSLYTGARTPYTIRTTLNTQDGSATRTTFATRKGEGRQATRRTPTTKAQTRKPGRRPARKRQTVEIASPARKRQTVEIAPPAQKRRAVRSASELRSPAWPNGRQSRHRNQSANKTAAADAPDLQSSGYKGRDRAGYSAHALKTLVVQ